MPTPSAAPEPLARRLTPRSEPMVYWAATQLEPRRERVAQHFLQLFGFEVYLPRVRRYLVRWRLRIEYQTPYFPGYCFTRVELNGIV